jgi:RNA polymerase sigma-70 factor (ECF subfamily)
MAKATVNMMNSESKNIKKDRLKSVIDGCLRNDNKSQYQLYKLFYSNMTIVCLRYAKDREEANDFVQEGFIKVFNNLKRYEFKGSFEGWIRRIFVNNAIDNIRRKKKNHLLLGEDEKLDAFAEKNFDGFEEQEELDPKIVMEAIQKLTPAYKAVFSLYVIEGYPHKEIAEMLSISVGTSKSNLAKAKQNLRKILKDAYNETYG